MAAKSNNDKFVWTIEHVLPEGENLPETWVQMLAAGDRTKAEEIQGEVMHLLGNLTLSAYNSNLSNRSFSQKQTLSQKKIGTIQLKIGYENGLSLNNLKFNVNGNQTSLSDINKWDKTAILARTEQMVEKLIELFRFENKAI